MEKIIITAAVVGSHTHREQTQHLPMTPEEVAEEAFQAYQAGASIIHLHPKDPNPEKSDTEVTGEIIRLIRKKCDAIIQVGTGQVNRFNQVRNQEERLDLLNIVPMPEMETINAGTFHFSLLSPSAKLKCFLMSNPPALIEAFARGMVERKMHIEFEVYDLSHLRNIQALIDSGVMPADYPYSVNFVFGMGGSTFPDPRCILYYLDYLPKGIHWTACGVGKYQTRLISMAMVMGGHVRVGLEDNIYLYKGVLAKGNRDLVEKVMRMAREMEREVATAEEARAMLRIE